jgi:hypothetical protein
MKERVTDIVEATQMTKLEIIRMKALSHLSAYINVSAIRRIGFVYAQARIETE